jgi:bisphosphoglycerate-dependent phosphoglycerate mutase
MALKSKFLVHFCQVTCTKILQHGESQYNLEGKIGGDAKLSERGELYARKLPELVRQSVGVCLIFLHVPIPIN